MSRAKAAPDELEALRDQGVWAVPCPQCEASAGERCHLDSNDAAPAKPHQRRVLMYVARKRRLTRERLPVLLDTLRPRIRRFACRKIDASIRQWAWAEAIRLIAADLTWTGTPITSGEQDGLLLLAEVSDVDRTLLHAVQVRAPDRKTRR